jgi:hypothetical protein
MQITKEVRVRVRVRVRVAVDAGYCDHAAAVRKLYDGSSAALVIPQFGFARKK